MPTLTLHLPSSRRVIGRNQRQASVLHAASRARRRRSGRPLASRTRNTAFLNTSIPAQDAVAAKPQQKPWLQPPAAMSP